MPRRSRSRGGLSEWLSQTAQPLFVIDSRGVVLFFNRGCEQLTGWAAGDLIGKVAVLHTSGNPDDVATILSALVPPGVAEPTSQRVHLLARDGQGLDRTVHFFPLPPQQADPPRKDEPLRWVGVIALPQSTVAVSPISAESTLHAELSALKAELRRKYSLTHVVAASSAMRRVMAQLQLALASNTTIAFSGATGTGKEHLARAVHYAGESRVRAFIPVDCRQPSRTLDETLQRLTAPEREELPIPVLRRGAVLLQHIEQLPREWQQRLTDEVDLAPGRNAVRWMIATSMSFDELVEQERMIAAFRDRFGVLEVRLPTLRERAEELPLLAQHALEEAQADSEKHITGLTSEVWQQFHAYNWPGQLDELFAVIREAHAASPGPLVTVADLPFRFRAGQDAQSIGPAVTVMAPLEETLAKIERDQIVMALEQARGNKSLAADLLGIPRPKLYRRMEAYGISDDFNSSRGLE